MRPITAVQHLPSKSKIFYLRLVVMLSTLVSQTAFAEDGGLLEGTPIVNLACNVINILTGPAAFLIAVLVIAIGGIAIAVGGKRVIGGVVWGILGVGIAIAATNIAEAIVPTDTAGRGFCATAA